ncbi:hypothetical protein [Curtobacterium sp. PhB115]|uniref:hypothetical protein n=1 Tax=Curtobacterium sp. PhB115 TaxID=2485173 RepID=UPI000F4AFB7F|nr:hypothetical protein [Curtobacterium sp. PhB115]
MLLAECSTIAVAGTANSDSASAASPIVAPDLPTRCDRILHDIAAYAAGFPAQPAPPRRLRTELVVDGDFPLDLATVHLAAALIADESVLLGLSTTVGPGTFRYLRVLATLLPGGVLHIARGDRLVHGGTDRVVWLSPTCVTDQSPVVPELAMAMLPMVSAWRFTDGTSDPA